MRVMTVTLVNHFHVGFTLFATEMALRRSMLKWANNRREQSQQDSPLNGRFRKGICSLGA
jgi:hypothetical protein